MSTVGLTWAILAAVAIAAWALTGLTRRYALARLIDVPNDRSSHHTPTPRGGGLAIVLAFGCGNLALLLADSMSATFMSLLAGSLLVAAAGFWDDHGHVPVRLRLAVHAAAGGLAIGALGGFPEVPLGAMAVRLGWLGAAFALLWTVWLLNLFNFMDGIDAIAATETLFVACAAIALMSLHHDGFGPGALALGVLASATTGFLWWNWPPARIFLGDVGSGFLGFSLAVIALADMRGPTGGLGLPTWILLNGVFVVDATYTLLRRIATGQQWYSAHRSHAYQKAAVMLGGHRPVVAYVASLNVFWLFPCALAATLWPGIAVPVLVVALLPLFAVAVMLKAGDP